MTSNKYKKSSGYFQFAIFLALSVCIGCNNTNSASKNLPEAGTKASAFSEEEKKRVLAGEFDLEKVPAAIKIEASDNSLKAQVGKLLNIYISWDSQLRDKDRRTKWMVFYQRRNTKLFHSKAKIAKADAIAKIKNLGKDAINPIGDYLKSPDEDIAFAASEALSCFGEDAVPKLLELAKSENEKTALYAANGLAKLGAVAVKPLMKAVSGKNKDASYAAMVALSKLPIKFKGSNLGNRGVLDAKDARVLFSKVALTHPDERVRQHAIIALKQLLPSYQNKNTDVLEVYGKALTQDKSSDNRYEVVNIINFYSQRSSSIVAPLIPYLIKALSDDDRIADQASRCLIYAGRDNGKDGASKVKAVALLTKALDRPKVRRSALEALASMGSDASDAVPKIVSMLDDEKTFKVAIMALVEIDPTNDNISKRLDSLFAEKNRPAFKSLFILKVLESLGKKDATDASQALKICRELIKDKSYKVRAKTAYVIGVYGDYLRMMIPQLEEMRDKDPAGECKNAAKHALENM